MEDAETPVRHVGLHIPDGHLRTVVHGIRGEAPDPNRADGLTPGSSRHGQGSASAAFGSEAGLKPMRDETRKMPPFGSPKDEGQHDQASRRSTGGIASSQVDPPQGGTGANAQRHGRWRDRSPLRLPECLDGPAPPAFVRPPAAPRGVRLNGFPGAPTDVPRHRFGGGGCRVRDAAPTAVFGASKVGQPAYPGYNPGAGEGLRPFDPQLARAPVDCAGGGVAPLPPVAARPDG